MNKIDINRKINLSKDIDDIKKLKVIFYSESNGLGRERTAPYRTAPCLPVNVPYSTKMQVISA